MNNERPGLARMHKQLNRHVPCEVYTCTRPGAYVIEHREGMFGTAHMVLCKECTEAMLKNLPDELQEFVVATVLGDPLRDESVVELLRQALATTEIQALAKGEPITETGRRAVSGLIGVLAEALDGPPGSQVSSLPEELRSFDTTVVPDTVTLIRAVQESSEVQALSKGEDVPDEVRQALGGLIDLLAGGGAEVTTDAPVEVEDKPKKAPKPKPKGKGKRK